MRFTKMHGIGNDYVYVNLFEETVKDAPALAWAVSRPHFGIGADGLILIGPGENAAFRMTVYNADGSRAKMCGNGARCVGKYLYDRGFTRETEIPIETDSGLRTLHIEPEVGKAKRVTVDMGAPQRTFEEIPCLLGTGAVCPVHVEACGRAFSALPIGMGNPHCVIFSEEPANDALLRTCGAALEKHPGFPQGANVEFARVLSRTSLSMRVWERGSGITLACGTGASATLAAAVLLGLSAREVRISLDGGELLCSWDEATDHIFMTGPASFVFDGEWFEEADDEH